MTTDFPWFPVDPNMFAGVKKVFGSSDDKKELVDPYAVFSFAGTEVSVIIDILQLQVIPIWSFFFAQLTNFHLVYAMQCELSSGLAVPPNVIKF